MKTSPPALLPIFRSHLQGRLLAEIFVFDRFGGQATVSALARRLDAPVTSVHRETKRLVDAGIFEMESAGRSRILHPGTRPAYVKDLERLVLKTFGPAPMLGHLLALLKGVDQACIFGSWAERYLGRVGPSPADIDLLVLGHPRRDEVLEAIEAFEREVDLSVDVHIYPLERWESSATPLLTTIKAGDHVWLDLERVGSNAFPR